jgi:hypothetical protein
MGALLGAVIGVALALIVETGRADVALGRERTAVLAASPPSSHQSARAGPQLRWLALLEV